MRLRPRIDTPCPLRFGNLPQPGMDFCRRCERRVHNLDAMGDAERSAFMAACSGQKICVAYSVRRTPLLAASAGLTLLAGCAATPDPAALAQAQIEAPAATQDDFWYAIGGVDDAASGNLVDADDGVDSQLAVLPQAEATLWLDETEPATFVAP